MIDQQMNCVNQASVDETKVESDCTGPSLSHVSVSPRRRQNKSDETALESWTCVNAKRNIPEREAIRRVLSSSMAAYFTSGLRLASIIDMP